MGLPSSTLHVAKRELRRIGDHKGIYLLIVVTPLVLFALLTYLYHDRIVKDIPIAVCDFDQSQLSRTFIRSIASTRSLTIRDYTTFVDEIKDKFRNGDIHGAFVIPHRMENNVKSGKPVSIVVFTNTANLVLGNLITKEALQISGTISAGIMMKKLQSSGLSQEAALSIANPIRVEVQSIGNPGYNYQNYMVSGLLPFMFQLIVIIASVLIINGEHREGTFGELVRTAEGKVAAIIGGKLLAHLGIHTISLLLMLGVMFPYFNAGNVQSYLTVFVFSLYFASVNICLGMLISTMFRDQVFATEVASFTTIPSFIFSGFTFPLWGMPDLHVFYAHLLPFTYFMDGLVKVYFLKSPWKYLLPEAAALTLFLVLSIVPVAWLLNRQVKTCLEEYEQSEEVL